MGYKNGLFFNIMITILCLLNTLISKKDFLDGEYFIAPATALDYRVSKYKTQIGFKPLNSTKKNFLKLEYATENKFKAYDYDKKGICFDKLKDIIRECRKGEEPQIWESRMLKHSNYTLYLLGTEKSTEDDPGYCWVYEPHVSIVQLSPCDESNIAQHFSIASIDKFNSIYKLSPSLKNNSLYDSRNEVSPVCQPRRKKYDNTCSAIGSKLFKRSFMPQNSKKTFCDAKVPINNKPMKIQKLPISNLHNNPRIPIKTAKPQKQILQPKVAPITPNITSAACDELCDEKGPESPISIEAEPIKTPDISCETSENPLASNIHERAMTEKLPAEDPIFDVEIIPKTPSICESPVNVSQNVVPDSTICDGACEEHTNSPVDEKVLQKNMTKKNLQDVLTVVSQGDKSVNDIKQ